MCQLYFCNNVIIPNFLINIVKNRSLSIWLQKFSMIVLRNQFRLDDTHMFILITFQKKIFFGHFSRQYWNIKLWKIKPVKKVLKILHVLYAHALYL